MLHYAQAEDGIRLALQDEGPKDCEMRRVLKAARRVRQKTRKIAARLYDGLQIVNGHICAHSYLSQTVASVFFAKLHGMANKSIGQNFSLILLPPMLALFREDGVMSLRKKNWRRTRKPRGWCLEKHTWTTDDSSKHRKII